MNFHAVLQETSGIFLSKGLHFATIVCNKKALPIYYVQFMGSFQPLSFTFQQLSILNIAWLCRRPESFCVILYSPPQVTFYERAWKKQRVERDTGALAAAMLLLLQCVFCSNHWETTLHYQSLKEYMSPPVSTKGWNTAQCHRGVGARDSSAPLLPLCFWKVNDTWIIYTESVRYRHCMCRGKEREKVKECRTLEQAALDRGNLGERQ